MSLSSFIKSKEARNFFLVFKTWCMLLTEILKWFPLITVGTLLFVSSDKFALHYNPSGPSETNYWHYIVVWVYIVVEVIDEVIAIVDKHGFDSHLHHVSTVSGMFCFLLFPHITARAAFMIGINKLISPIFFIFNMRKHPCCAAILQNANYRSIWRVLGMILMANRFVWNSTFAYRSFLDAMFLYELYGWNLGGRCAAALALVLCVLLMYLDVMWAMWIYRYKPRATKTQMEQVLNENQSQNVRKQIRTSCLNFKTSIFMLSLGAACVIGAVFMWPTSEVCPQGYDQLNNFVKSGVNEVYYSGIPGTLSSVSTLWDNLRAAFHTANLLRVSESKCVKLYNARHAPTKFDKQGFTLVDMPNGYDWTSSEAVDDYVADVNQMLRTIYPEAKHIECSEPVIRGEESNSPIRSVHFDYWSDMEENYKFGGVTAAHFLDLLDRYNSTKALMIGVWKPIQYTVEDDFLALLDMESFSETEATKVYYDYPAIDNDGEKYQLLSIGGSVQHHPKQRWFYYSNMQPWEALVFTHFDSEAFKVNAHTSVHRGMDKAPRRSIETRAYIVL